MTKLLAGGGVGVLLVAMLVYFLRYIDRRDDRDEKRSLAFLQVTQAAVEAIARVDARAGIVVDAIKGLSVQVVEVGDQLDRIEDRMTKAEPPAR